MTPESVVSLVAVKLLEARAEAVMKIFPGARVPPPNGIIEDGELVTYKVFPTPFANKLVGVLEDPTGDKLELLNVHPVLLFPETMDVSLPLIYMPTCKAGEPKTVKIFPRIYPLMETFAPPINPEKVLVIEMVEPFIVI